MNHIEYKVFIFVLILERENRGTWICYSTYLCTHWLILICALTRDQTCNLGASGWCSNQLSYPARASWKTLENTLSVEENKFQGNISNKMILKYQSQTQNYIFLDVHIYVLEITLFFPPHPYISVVDLISISLFIWYAAIITY